MSFIAKSKIRHNGIFYNVGDEVLGLTKGQAERLVQLDALEGDGEFLPDKPNKADLISPEEFAKLQAPEQKAQLEVCNILPAGKSEDRVQQYSEWYTVQE